MRALLADHCCKDCLAGGGNAIRATLALDKAPFEAKCADEGYCLAVTDKEITITGYGEAGLLYGVISLEQLCAVDARNTWLPAVKVIDWPDCPYRGFAEECRVGSDMMRRDEWMTMLDDLLFFIFIFMQFFADVADYARTHDELDMLDLRPVLSQRSWWLR